MAFDSSPLEGAGRVEDTINLLAHAARKLLTCVAELVGWSQERVCVEAGIPLLVATSVTKALDVDWTTPEAQAAALQRLVKQLDALEGWVQRRLSQELAKPPLQGRVATLLAICHPQRAHGHKVFAGLAQWGRSSLGWCDDFKLHLLINDIGELLACRLTAANVDDRVLVPTLVEGLRGKLFGDRGYISRALFEDLFAQGLQLITKIRKDMKNELLSLLDKLLLRKRLLIETVHDQLKNICQIEHSRHRCVANFLVNLVAG